MFPSLPDPTYSASCSGVPPVAAVVVVGGAGAASAGPDVDGSLRFFLFLLIISYKMDQIIKTIVSTSSFLSLQTYAKQNIISLLIILTQTDILNTVASIP